MAGFSNSGDWELFFKVLFVLSIIGVVSVVGSCSYGIYWAWENIEVRVKESE